ncbi:MAG: L,D-transpeptidase family protein [Flavobacterium sp.]|nr:L,D-transpeptidase family protein [Flavobacterium sp.]
MITTNFNRFGIFILMIFALASCKSDKKIEKELKSDKFAVDSTKLEGFFAQHPDFKDYKDELYALYSKHDNRLVWFDTDGRNEFAEVLYDKARKLGSEGVTGKLPYSDKYESMFASRGNKPNLENDILISSMYFYYADKVYKGIDPQKSKDMGWYLPRPKKSLVDYLDELMKDEDLINKDETALYPMYYNLRTALHRYRKIRDSGGWGTITLPEGTKVINPGDDMPAVAQLRKRLYISGDLKSDNGSTKYDDNLVDAVKLWQKNHSVTTDGIVGPVVIDDLNIPVEMRIKTILVNMERCRWISPDLVKNEEYIMVNIPSYKMQYIEDGKTTLESRVVVGKELNKTVIFSGKISYLVFSPYWNVPNSILQEEILPAIERDPNYLEKHNMEWHDERVRQRPGNNNSLGLVKFMFPNSNNIYLHDTPAKSLFQKDDRALSHGCVRVEKARELAIKLLEDEKNWGPDKIDAAMRAGTETSHPLNQKVPVYLAYFTALADDNGQVSFYDDVYSRDERLARQLYNE